MSSNSRYGAVDHRNKLSTHKILICLYTHHVKATERILIELSVLYNLEKNKLEKKKQARFHLDSFCISSIKIHLLKVKVPYINSSHERSRGQKLAFNK